MSLKKSAGIFAVTVALLMAAQATEAIEGKGTGICAAIPGCPPFVRSTLRLFRP